jgi:5-methyltetrahydrofolate--homocysteine methyltransferase
MTERRQEGGMAHLLDVLKDRVLLCDGGVGHVALDTNGSDMAHILDVLKDRVLLCDGGFGSRVQAAKLDVDKDFWGKENCTDILTRSRPDFVRDVHRSYFMAGSDLATTNTFGGSPVTLGEFGIAEEAFDLNKAAAELVHEVIDELKGDGRQRFVMGDIGPGTKLPSLGHIEYQVLEDALFVQCAEIGRAHV